MSTKNKLNAQQRRCAEILASNDIHKLTMDGVAEEVGISRATLYRWKMDRAFIDYMNEVAEKLMDEFIHEAYTMLKDMARMSASDQARLKALELALKNRGKLTDKQTVDLNVRDDRTIDVIEDEIEDIRRRLSGDNE